MGPILDQLAREHSGRLKVAKINVDQNPMTSATYSILSIPTLLFFKNGKLVGNMPGAVQKPQIDQMLASIL
jgi:thioredoxin-like negative regulator of GroEL